jgi:thiamine-monophosphate kinase
MVEGVHFFASEEAYYIAWKAVATTLSDLAAMGACAHSILLNISLPKLTQSWLQGFAAGLEAICNQYQVDIVGGDTTHSPTMVVSVTAIGTMPQGGKPLCRRGAADQDLILVTNHIGAAAYALQHYETLKASNNNDISAQFLLAALRQPLPQLKLGQALHGYASALIDISDGLLQDVAHIARASHLQAHIDLDAIPLAPAHLAHMAKAIDLQIAVAAATGGDDYQLCTTMSVSQWQQFGQHSAAATHFTVIGRMHQCAQAACAVKAYWQRTELQIDKLGYQHFS